MKSLTTYVVYDGIKCLRRSTSFYELQRYCNMRAHSGKDGLVVEKYNRDVHNARDAEALRLMKEGKL